MIFDFHIELNTGEFSLQQSFQSDQSVVAIYGPSGAGKTSILHAIAGIQTPKSGWIKINNNVWFDVNQKINLSTQKRRVGLVFQDAQLFPHKTVNQNLMFGYKRIEGRQHLFKPDYIIDLLKLEHLLGRMPMKLSGGEKQRVALGRALLYSPELLLFDEPLSALDSMHKAEIIPFFQKIKNEINIPMLYVSHDMNEIQQLTSTIWRL